MKIFKYTTISLLSLTLVLSSCGEDFITVDPTANASGEQIEELATNNPDKIMIIVDPLLAGLYNYMNQYNTQGSSGIVHNDFGFMSTLHLGDVMTNDLAFDDWGSGWFSYDYQFDYRSEQYVRPYYYWNFYYTIVNQVNSILTNIPSGVDSDEVNIAKGQALALRGMAYYYLINMYQKTYSSLSDPTTAPGIPLIYAPTEEKEIRLDRAPVSLVFEQMEEDLLDAITLLENFNRPAKTAIDKSVAQVLLSRVYLTMERWADAETMARTARQNSNARLMTAEEVAVDGFNDINNSEWMWGADITSETATSFASFFSFVCTFDAGYGGVVGQYRKIDARLYSNFSSTDARLAQFKSPDAPVDPESSDRRDIVPAYTNFKFKSVSGWQADYVFMRLSETYLTEAEALAHQGKNAEAATVLKQLMANRDPSWNKTSVTAEEVYTQRRLELWAEGFSFFDHRRLHIDLERNYTGTNHLESGRFNYPADDWIFIYQIPRREYQQNDQITEEDQNP